MRSEKEWESLTTEEKKAILKVAYEYYHRNSFFKGTLNIPNALDIMARYRFVSVLDYGCGKAAELVWDTEVTEKILQSAIGRKPKLYCYDPFHQLEKYRDPAVLEKDYDLVCAFDVLEHLLPEEVEDTLKLLFSRAKKMVFFNIHTGPATKKICDESGKNLFNVSLHTTVRAKSWWIDKIKEIEQWLYEKENRYLSVRLEFGA